MNIKVQGKKTGGIYPQDWEQKKIKDITTYVDYRGKTPTKVDQGVFLVTAKNIKDGYIDYDVSKEYVKVEEYDDIMRRGKPKIGDVLITTEAPMGNVAQIDREDIALAQRVIKLRGKLGVDNTYLKYHFLGDIFQNKLKKLAIGTTVAGIKGKELHNMKIPLPSIKEQQKIASILSTWDKAIELKEKLIEQKKEQKKGLMQRLLMGHIRMNDRANSTKEVKERLRIIERGGIPKGYKKTKIGIIPKTWKLIRLKDRFDRLTKKNSENNTNVLTISAQHGLVNQQKYFNKSVASANLSNYYILSKGDFAYNKSYSNGYPYGAIKVLKDYEAGVVSPLYICFTPKKDNLSPEFYEYYFEAGLFNREIHAIAQEGARNHGLLNVSINDFFNLHVVDLDIDEMKEISNVISLSIKEVELLEQELNNLKQQKKGLMQLLLSGKVRVQV